MSGNRPSPAYPDGYLTGGQRPDLLLTGTSASTPSLWLCPTNADGALGAPTDIGSLGTAIPHTDQTSNGPACRWTGRRRSGSRL